MDTALLTMKDVARILGIHRVTAQRWLDSGRLPRPIRLGRRAIRWPPEEFHAWIGAGCPVREKWEMLREGKSGDELDKYRILL
jgi:excisionase family DNA binding protein